MNDNTISFVRGMTIAGRNVSKSYLAAALVVLIAISWAGSVGRAQAPASDAAGTTVLTRGPVHEAFAGVITFNPEPGVVVAKDPPAVIEEMPPEERPEGDNVTWIPGYWAWDDERSDFLWVSGTWRALPPGRAWMAGYWGNTAQGYQWTSGYWADATAKETTYLPAPPVSVEVGPNIEAPSADYGWSPGCWVWYQNRYAWQPGYWVLGRADWDWCPGHYVWTPRGYIFVGGYWDYPVARRGILFAPVYFETGWHARHGFFYSPTIVISLGVFSDHLFLRPSYCHYYFGDYYAPSYYRGGFYASFSFQSSHHGYDPIYSHQRWEHRQDHEWEHHAAASYEHRRDNEAARPPRTWAAQRNLNLDSAEARQNHVMMAAPIDQVAKRKDGPLQFQPVAKAERQKLAQRGEAVQQARDQRRTLETQAAGNKVGRPGAALEPVQVKLPRSPIVAKPISRLGRDQAPPKVQSAPRPDSNPNRSGTKVEAPGRPPSVDRGSPSSAPRQLEPERKPAPDRREPVPRVRPAQPEPQPRTQESDPKVQEKSQRNHSGLESGAQPGAERRAREAVVQPSENLQRNSPALETKARPDVNPRPQVPASNGRDYSPPNADAPPRPAPPAVEPPRQPRQDPSEKGASKLIRNNSRQSEQGRP